MRPAFVAAGWESRRLWGIWGVGALAALLILAWPGVGNGMGLEDRTLLIIGRAVLPLFAVLVTSGVIVDDARAGILELAATSRRGLAFVWFTRFGARLAWVLVAALVFLVPIELRGTVRHGLGAEVMSSLVDVILFATAASAGALRAGSEVAGVLFGLGLWVAGVLAGIEASAHAWIGHLTPLSVYFFGPVQALLVNRVIWLLLALALGVVQVRGLEEPTRLIPSGE